LQINQTYNLQEFFIYTEMVKIVRVKLVFI
jgi:hypothetical protein